MKKVRPRANGHDVSADLRELPSGWMWVRLEELASPTPRSITDGPFGSNLKSEHYTKAGPRVIRLENIGHGQFIDKPAHVSLTHYRRLERHAIDGGDLVIAILGSPLPRTCIVPASLGPAIVKADCIRFKPDAALIDNRFACWWINSKEPQKAAEQAIHGVGRPRLGMQSVKDLMIPLAPRPEQTRIVAKIDELFSDIEAGEKALERAALLVKRYRQSVLKAAVTGELTKDWRAKNLARLKKAKKTGADLLADILKRRREAWEAAELGKLTAKGKPPKDDKWKKKYVEPAGPKTDELPELPEGWIWTSVGQIFDVETGATPKRGTDEFYKGGTIAWITSGAVNRDQISSANEFITAAAVEKSNVKVFPAGTLVLAMYGEGKTRGKCSELKIDAATNQACAALLTHWISDATKKFVRVFLEHNYESMRRRAAGGVQPNLNLEIVRSLPFPLAPIDEQVEVDLLVEERLTEQLKSATTVEQERRRIVSLRSSILQSAFSGHLVDQNPNDEPASVLLERIKAERAAPTNVAKPAAKKAAKAKQKRKSNAKPGRASKSKQLDLI